MGFHRRYIKPLFDYSFAFIGLILFAPVWIIVLIVNSAIFRQPIFIHKRIGLNEIPFLLYKFRTYKTDDDQSTIPRWGKFLRITSIDEIPQLYNILKGQMSLVGPRPLLPEYLEHYNENQRKRHQVKPGISGLSQVKGRNKLSWEESLELDAFYSENLSFALDIKILVLTIIQVFKFGEVNQFNNQSREPFHKQ